MAAKIKNLLFNNIGYKLLALLFAIILWFIVVNLDDPTRTSTFTTQIQLDNTDVLTSAGKYYKIEDNQSTVSFRVSAKRSVIDKLTNEDFYAVSTVPDSDYSDFSGELKLDIFVYPEKYTNQITVLPIQKKLTLSIGNEEEGSFEVNVITTGEPAEGFAIESVTANPNRISISGPDAVMRNVDSAVAYIDINGANADVFEDVSITLLDSDNNPIEDISELSISNSVVNVLVDVVSEKVVPIRVETEGELPEGYELDSVSTDPEEVLIMGESDKLNDITEIVIPPTVISLNQATEDIRTTVDITLYLPEGIRLKDTASSSVKITVKLKEETEKAFTVITENIKLENVNDSYTYEFDEESVLIRVNGLPSALESLQENDITGSIDCAGLLPGNHTLTLDISLPDGISLGGDAVTTKITIREKQSTEGE